MSLIETLTAWDAAVNCYDREAHTEALNKLREIHDPSSKLLFNMACIELQRGFLDESLQYLNSCLKKDGHLAVGFYQKGVVLFNLERYEDALNSFKQCLSSLRGKSVIDYKQLGLHYILYECETLHNTAAVFSKLNDFASALDLLGQAQGCEVVPKHNVIDKSLENLKAGYAPNLLQLPKNAIFRPPKSKTSNIGKKNYLGEAKVISSVKENDNFSGFSGPQKLEVEKQKVLSLSAPSSPSSNHKMDRSTSPGAPTLFSSPIQYLKESLSPNAAKKSRSPSPAEKQRKHTEFQQSPEHLQISQKRDMMTLSPPRDKVTRVSIPPPPTKPAPRLVVSSSFHAGDILGDHDYSRKSRDRSERIKNRWTMAIGQIIQAQNVERGPSPVPARENQPKPIQHTEGSSSVHTKNTQPKPGHFTDQKIDLLKITTTKSSSTSRSEDKACRTGKDKRNIPPPPTKPLPVPPPSKPLPVPPLSKPLPAPPPSKPLPVPPVPDRSRRKILAENTSSDIGRPSLPPREKKPFSEVTSEKVSIVLHCNQPVTVEVALGLPLWQLIREACERFQLAEDSIDLWWQGKEKGDITKIESEVEMIKIWKEFRPVGGILDLWCYAKR